MGRAQRLRRARRQLRAARGGAAAALPARRQAGTRLQGYVPPADLATGRAAQGYNCNLGPVGYFHTVGGSTLDSLGDCLARLGAFTGAGAVLDVSDPTAPLPTATLTTAAMTNAWESMRVNAKRELLVADNPNNSALDIYDVSGDCRTPRLLSSTELPPAIGHEGWFSPDGMTYYMSSTRASEGVPTVFPVDISDPSKPRLLGTWEFESQTPVAPPPRTETAPTSASRTRRQRTSC